MNGPSKMPDAHYITPRLAALYDLDSGWSPDRDFYLGLAGTPPQDILDLGCGTGLLAAAYAALGHRVTGVDPAPAMLDVARGRKDGHTVRWIAGTADALVLPDRFDLIIMTGHAFQVLLTDTEVDATLRAMCDHLKPGGRAAFETRNPAVDWVTLFETDVTVPTPDGPVHESRRCTGWDGLLLSFATTYWFPDTTLVSDSTLRFHPPDVLLARIAAQGLQVTNLHGDWQGGPFDADRSKEMILTLTV
jgi:SAM-dependent methyltransferase